LETLQRAVASFEKLQPSISPDLAEVLLLVARADLAAHDVAGAVAASTRAVQFWETFDAANRSTGAALLWQARAFNKAGEVSKERDALQRAGEILNKLASPVDRGLLEQVRRNSARPAPQSG
jgi:tetratricopeptide (TPR) repeat protein